MMRRKINTTERNEKQVDLVSGENLFTLPKKNLFGLNLFCYGLIVYTVGYVGSVCYNDIISSDIFQGVQIIGLILIIGGTVSLAKFKFENAYLKIVFPIYILYSLSVIIRGWKFDYKFMKLVLFNVDYTIFVYLVPLVLLFPKNLAFYKRINGVVFTLGYLFLVTIVLSIKTVHDSNWANTNAQYVIECLFLYLAYPIAFILITYIYQTQNKRLLAFGILIISIYFLIYRARRGSLFMGLTTLTGIGIVYLIYTKKKSMVILLSALLLAFSSVSVSNIQLPSFFNFLMARGDDDTRTYVEVCMKADMSDMDWIIGKGISGTYYCPGVVDDPNDLSFQRIVVETGYLQIILQGGLCSLILLGLVVLPAIYFGLFKSKNILSKGAAVFILLWAVYQYPRIVNSFSMYYILVWISVGICYSKKIRNLSDRTIGKYLTV